MTDRDKKSVVVYVVLAFGLGWVVMLPLLLGDGLKSPWATLYMMAMMFVPSIAVLLTLLILDRRSGWWRRLGLWPLRPVGRWFGYMGLALLVPIAIVFIDLLVAKLLGQYEFDLANFSGFAQSLDAVGANPEMMGMTVQTFVLIQLLAIVPGSFINVIPALGEELGWRGWLVPKLLPLGVWPALLISGAIWGLWHAPALVMGYNYPLAPSWLAIIMMMGACIMMGSILSWLRIRSNSVWPAALGHGAFNATASVYVLLGAADQTVNTVHQTILGWSGWIVPAIFILILYFTGQYKWPQSQEPAQQLEH